MRWKLHTCAAPVEAVERWLTDNGSIRDRYGHLLLEQKVPFDNELIADLKRYFESAHLDARQHFHNQIGIDLHPDADVPGAHACYPNCLPPTAIRGLFGEVMAGLLTECYQSQFVGGHQWCIPIFLFRYHHDVEKYLYDLSRAADRERSVFGRFGSDFIGVCLDDEKKVLRFIVGEAKWRKTYTASTVQDLLLGRRGAADKDGVRKRTGGIWLALNRDTPIPHGLRQLSRLLEEHDPDGFSATIASLDRALVVADPAPLPRTNLVLLAGESAPDREPGEPMVDWETCPGEYTAPHDLQVVELILTDGDQLIDELYSCLWQETA